MKIPIQLQKKEFRFCKIKPRDKRPFEFEWQKRGYVFDDIELVKWIESNNNYGCIGGHGRLRILDIDDVNLSNSIMKKVDTFTVETGGGGKHFYFICDYSKNHVLVNELGELRAENYQVVGPSCIHPNGNTYSIINENEVKFLTNEELIDLIKPYLKKEGEKVDTSRSGKEWAEVMRLVKKGNNFEEVDKIMQAFVKWTTATQAYKEYTYNAALEAVKNDKSYNLQSAIEKSLDFKGIAKRFIKDQPIYFDPSHIWWLWDKGSSRWEMVDDIDLMNRFDDMFSMASEKPEIKNRLIESLKKEGRKNKPKTIPTTWVQFEDDIVDIDTGDQFKAESKWFVTNPVPWSIGESEETPILDKIFAEWVGEEYVNMLYEICSYCLLADYPIHRIFCFIGDGSNGKGSFIRFLERFVGERNYTSSDIMLLTRNDFESSKLFKKLLCTIGEIDKSIFTKTSLLKRLSGQDTIGMQFKRKDLFVARNYAKIVIATNFLPETTDKSAGFYRRWAIVDFPRQFPEAGKNIIDMIPEVEYNNLAKKSIRMLRNLLRKGKFDREGDILQRKQRYEEHANVIDQFIGEFCAKDIESYIKFSDFFVNFTDYLKSQGQRGQSKIEVSKVLRDRGYEIKVKGFQGNYTAQCVFGLKWVHEMVDDFTGV